MSACYGPGLCRYAGRRHAVCVDVLTYTDRVESHLATATADAAAIVRQVTAWPKGVTPPADMPTGGARLPVIQPAGAIDECLRDGCVLFRVTTELPPTTERHRLGYLVCRRCGTRYNPVYEEA